MADSAAWTLSGIEPVDNTFRGSDEDTKRAFWRWISSIGVDRFHWRCNRGLDRNGEELTAIAASTRARGRKRSYTGLGNADNPPLVPALGLSRTEALLKGRGFSDHAEWYWRDDPVSGLHWGQVMLWHAAGGGGRYPQRDVIGWSTSDIAWLRAEGQRWWWAHQHGQAVARAMNEIEAKHEKFPRLPEQRAAPTQFKVTGRTDVEHFTFGIGGTEQMVRRSIEEGTSSGFRRLGRERPPRPGGKMKPGPAPAAPIKPKAKPKPAAKRPAAVAASKAPFVNPYAAMPPLKAAPAPAAAGEHSPDLATFAARAKAAAATVQGAGRFSEEKVLISHAHSAYVKAHGPIPLVTSTFRGPTWSKRWTNSTSSRARLSTRCRATGSSTSSAWGTDMDMDLGGIDRILGQCQRFRAPDPKPLLTKWERRIKADNERGIMAGQDKDGEAMPAVTYRPKGDRGKWGRKEQKAHLGRASHIGKGRVEETAGNNLTSAQYRKLAGPPLAPRGKLSRVITNLYTIQGFDSSRGVFYAVGAWADVISKKGVAFLIAHFTGANTGRFSLKVRDLRGIRPAGQKECLDDLEAWGEDHAKATFV
jgi:hypothetical protein